MLKFEIISNEKQYLYNQRLIEFEKNFSYPLGDDRFVISHGKNYFEFFNGIGESTHFVALHGKEIVAAVAIILRKDILENAAVYYVCDLKILPAYRGKNIMQLFIDEACRHGISQTEKFYSISMDEAEIKENRLLKATSRMQKLTFEAGGKLLIYLVDVAELPRIAVDLQQYFGAYTFKTLHNVKDLILQSSSSKINLVHLMRVDSVECASKNAFAQDDVKFMFCVPAHSDFVNKLASKAIYPFASANILQRNMKLQAWNFISSAEL